MALDAPQLDDRSFQNIVNEAKNRISHYTPEWTDWNVSDPGVTLIELFAGMIEILLYRMNQVPRLHQIKFLELLGIKLQGPKPARVPVTFWLSKPQPDPVKISRGMEVTSGQEDGASQPVVFTTDRDLIVVQPEWEAAIIRTYDKNGQQVYHRVDLDTLRYSSSTEIAIFTSPRPRRHDAFYLGFANDLSNHILRLRMSFRSLSALGFPPETPPYVWEAGVRGGDWPSCDVDKDLTLGLNREKGVFEIHLPEDMHPHLPDGMESLSVNPELYWIRLRITRDRTGKETETQKGYYESPRLTKMEVPESIGGTIWATDARVVWAEIVGTSDGTPGQRFQLRATHILAAEYDGGNPAQLYILIDNKKESWIEVDNFAGSKQDDPHYTIDRVSGEIRFGPALRDRSGDIILFGRVPPRGASIVYENYRYGGRVRGKVPAGTLKRLKMAHSSVSRVTNRQDATRGIDAESVDEAMIRVAQELRTLERAVTPDDYVFLVKQEFPDRFSRVECFQQVEEEKQWNPGWVHLLVVPKLETMDKFLRQDQREPNDADIQAVTSFLDERRLISTHVEVMPPIPRIVAVYISLLTTPGVTEESVKTRLYRFLNPVTWPLGRHLYRSDVIQHLHDLRVLKVTLYGADEQGNARKESGDLGEKVEVNSMGVIVSGIHQVEFVDGDD